jgi:hypothetical protein
MAYFSTIAAPLMTSDELHDAFQLGAVEAMLHGFKGTDASESLFTKSKYIHELVRGTLQVVDGVLTSDLQLNPIEKSLKEYVTPNLQWIGKFCGTFSLATRHLSSTSSLLQLWTHEWKRFTLDPLPNGALKSRLMWSFKKKLNEIDQVSWGLNSGWLQHLIDSVEVTTDEIWMNPSLLTSAVYRLSDNGGSGSGSSDSASVYRPVEFHPDIPLGSEDTLDVDTLPLDNANLISPVGSGISSSLSMNEVLLIPAFIGATDMRSVLYPEAFSYVLRIVRLLSSVGSNIILPSHVGSHAVQALKLAASICHMKFFIYDCKDKREVSTVTPSALTLHSNDFKSFLKYSLLKVGGFTEVIAPNIKASVHYQQTQGNIHVEYTCVPPEKVLMVVTSTQLMSDNDRRLLQYAVDLDNPCLIFDNREITGIYHII